MPKLNRLSPARAERGESGDSAQRQHDSARLAAIVESSDDAIISKTLQGIITSWNQSAQRIFGYTAKEVVGKSITLLIPSERLNEETTILEQLRKGKRIDHFETVRMTKDGTPVEVSISVSPIRDAGGAIIGASKIARDISDRKAAMAAKQLAEQRLLIAAESAKIGFWERDLVTDEIVRSPEHARLMGMTELKNKFDSGLQHIHPDDRERVKSQVEKAIGLGERYQLECRILRPDGGVRWIEARGQVIRDERGVPIKMVGAAVDISDRKDSEEAARRRDAELAHLSRVSAMGNLAAGLAHELNQPLGAILNYASVGEKALKSAPVSIRTLQSTLNGIMEETRRASAIISRARSFVSKESPKSQILELNDVVRKAAGFLDFEMRQQGVSVELKLAGRNLDVIGDPIQIQQVLVNLMTNAAQAMDQKPRADRLLLIETLDIGARMARVSVVDRGLGMTQEQLSRLFEPFYTTKPQGLGLGLNISRSIVENHGGRLLAEANADGGMRFSFTIPLEIG